MIKQHSLFKSFEGMCWPFPCEKMWELERALIGGDATKEEALLAAAIIDAYKTLIHLPQRERNRIAEILKKPADFVYPGKAVE